MPGCDYPGCRKNSHAYDYYGDVTKKYSFHRVPDTQREVVCDMINLPEEKRHKVNIFICDSHLQPGSVVATNKKRKLRCDIPFSELVIPPGDATAASNGMDTSSFMAGSYSDEDDDQSYMSRNLEPEVEQEQEEQQEQYEEEQEQEEDQDQEQEEQEQVQFKVRLSPAKRRKSGQTRRYRRSPKQLPSPTKDVNTQMHAQRNGTDLRTKVDEIKLLMSGIASAELKAMENERKYLQLDQTLNQTQTTLLAEVESKDKEIASLKKHLQQVIAENKALSESNKALTVDLNVYRKLIQLETKSSLHHQRSPSASPSKKQWRGMRESSTDVDLGEEEPEESMSIGAGANSRGSLDEIRKWLKSNKKC